MIEITGLEKSFGAKKVLQGVNLKVEEDSSLVILGGSGTGKSVLIKTIIGLMEPDSGTVKIMGKETTNISRNQRLFMLANCGFLFQGGALFDSLTSEDNICFFANSLYKLSKKGRKELADEKLNAVGLPASVAKLYPAELSGGMQKRVALARAIATNPKIIFFDEPTTGLDPIMANVINELIVDARAKLGATTVTITHDLASAERIAQKIALMHEGKIIWQGNKDELKSTDNPYVHQFINGLTKGPIKTNLK